MCNSLLLCLCPWFLQIAFLFLWDWLMIVKERLYQILAWQDFCVCACANVCVCAFVLRRETKTFTALIPRVTHSITDTVALGPSGSGALPLERNACRDKMDEDTKCVPHHYYWHYYKTNFELTNIVTNYRTPQQMCPQWRGAKQSYPSKLRVVIFILTVWL